MIRRGDDASGAIFDPSERFRYRLWRYWSRPRGVVLWVMLNPSTADERVTDPTIRRCMSFSEAWGFGGVEIANVYALRSTDPRELWRAEDPVGPGNDAEIAAAMRDAARIVVAWGAHARRERVETVLRIHKATRPDLELSCLGVTKSGAPRHPLYVAGSMPWRGWSG